MSKKSLFQAAMEDINQVEATGSDEISADLAIVDQDMNEAVALQDQADQAEQNVEVIQQIEKAPTVEEKLEIAQEHLYSMIGLEKGIAFESHTERFDNALVIAQEGIFGRIGHTFKRVFTSLDRLERNIGDLKNQIPETMEGNGLIKDPGWGRVFNASNKRTLDGNDVLKSVKDIVSVVESAQFSKILKTATESINTVQKEFSKGNFFADKGAVQNIYEHLDTLRSDLNKLGRPAEFRQKGYDPDFKCANKQQAKKIIDEASGVFTAKFNKELDQYNRACLDFNFDFDFANNRVLGNFAADKRAIREVLKLLNEYILVLNTHYTALAKCIYGVQEYIKQSIKKG